MKFKKKIKIRPAFDKRDGDLRKCYGVHCASMIFSLTGDKGSVTFILHTGWHLQHVANEFEKNPDAYFLMRPLPVDISYHSRTPLYNGQEPREKACEYIGIPCYTDGSPIYAEEFYDELVTKGTKGLWKKMKAYYKAIFEGCD